jgi:hypothetical protein
MNDLVIKCMRREKYMACPAYIIHEFRFWNSYVKTGASIYPIKAAASGP